MAYILLPQRWKRQPHGPIELDETHWLVQKGIALYAPMGVFPGVVLGTMAVPTADGSTKVPGPTVPGGGVVSSFSGSGMSFALTVPRPWSCAAWGNNNQTEASQYAVRQNSSGNEGMRWAGATAGDPITARTSTSQAVTTSGYTVGNWAHGVAVFAASNSRVAYINGGSSGSQTTTSVQTFTSLDIAPDFTGSLAHVLVLPYALTADDVARLYAEQKENPHIIVKPWVRRTYFDVPGGAAETTGTLSATESGADTLAIAGDVFVKGALSASESGSDALAIAGDVLVEGALAATESGADACAIAGEGAALEATGALAASESGADTAAIAGKVYVSGTLSATEGALDAFAVSGNILIQGALDATESGADTAAFTAPATDSAKLDLILDILQNKQVLDPATGLFTLYADDNVTVLYTAAAWEDAAGTIPYSGGCVRRIDAMT